MNGPAWLDCVRHDLVKRLLWPARDRRDLGGPVQPGELAASLSNDDGAPITPAALWDDLRAQAPAGVSAAALDAFSVALAAATTAAGANDLAGVLALDAAFTDLARAVKGGA